MDELSTDMLAFMRTIIPDAVMLLLARPGADIWFSALEMNAAAYDDCRPFRAYGGDCAAGAAYAQARAHRMFDEGAKRAAAIEADGNALNLSRRAGEYVAKGGYAYALRHLWRTWPRDQTLVLESERVWARPRAAYDALCEQLALSCLASVAPSRGDSALSDASADAPLKPAAYASVQPTEPHTADEVEEP